MRTIRQAKAMAKTLRSELLERGGVDLSHAETLEIVAHQFGIADWNTLAAQLAADVQPPMASPDGFNLTIPVLRVFSESVARQFYVDFLGFHLDFGGPAEGEGTPFYGQVSRNGTVIHLAEPVRPKSRLHGHHLDQRPQPAARRSRREGDPDDAVGSGGVDAGDRGASLGRPLARHPRPLREHPSLLRTDGSRHAPVSASRASCLGVLIARLSTYPHHRPAEQSTRLGLAVRTPVRENHDRLGASVGLKSGGQAIRSVVDPANDQRLGFKDGAGTQHDSDRRREMRSSHA